MRMFIVNMLMFTVVGVLFNKAGFGFDTWQYWAGLGAMSIACVNTAFGE